MPKCTCHPSHMPRRLQWALNALRSIINLSVERHYDWLLCTEPMNGKYYCELFHPSPPGVISLLMYARQHQSLQNVLVGGGMS